MPTLSKKIENSKFGRAIRFMQEHANPGYPSKGKKILSPSNSSEEKTTDELLDEANVKKNLHLAGFENTGAQKALDDVAKRSEENEKRFGGKWGKTYYVRDAE